MSIHETILADRRSELVVVAKAMLDGSMHLIEGVRRICALRHAVGQPDDEVFMPIRSIESETDHFPLGGMRAHCSADYLERMDDEMNRYLDDAKPEILSACKEIIRIFS